MPLHPGTTLGPYAVTAKIGEGGMGEVYRARDTNLDRDVALKVLPQAFTDDPDRLARFEREAKVLASLNHPNIGHIYGLEEAEGQKALVLELVEGPTLADRIAEGPIPVDEALPIAKQIAEALEAAHEAGIIHRDLKPANIKVREDGTVKVLDFGLAKALDPNPTGDPSQSPTLTAAATQMGVIMGTAAYMSPEQASGKPVDKRADIWAFGCVLYEMLTGRAAFEGGDLSEVLAGVIKSEPNWEVLPANLPPALDVFLHRSMQKDARQRVRDIGDVRLAMAGAFDLPEPESAATPELSPPAPSLPLWQRPVGIGLVAVVVAVVSTLVFWALTRPEVAPEGLVRFTINPRAPLTSLGVNRDLAISPDGTRVIHVGQSSGSFVLDVRPVDQLVSAPLRGGENGFGPFFSPDGEWVGFVGLGGTSPCRQPVSGGACLQKASMRGGPPVMVAESPNSIRGASWGMDDQIIFGTNVAGLFRVAGGGGEPEPLTTPEDGVSHRWPAIIAGRGAVLFVTAAAGALTGGALAVLDLDTGDVTPLGIVGVSPHYVETGHVVYAVEDGSIRAVPFDATSLEVSGNPVPLVEGVQVKVSGAANFSISDNGRLVYAQGVAAAGVPRALVWVDRDGREEPLGDAWGPDQYIFPRFSPDGTRVAVVVAENADSLGTPADIWVLDLARGARSRITFEGNRRFFPVWSPDGTQLAFADGPETPNVLLLASADGSGQSDVLLDRSERQFPTSWAPDGHALAIYIDRPETSRDLAVLPMDGDTTPVPFVTTPFQERAATFSPDGRWLAYVSDESGQDEVYVRPYPGPGQETTVHQWR